MNQKNIFPFTIGEKNVPGIERRQKNVSRDEQWTENVPRTERDGGDRGDGGPECPCK